MKLQVQLRTPGLETDLGHIQPNLLFLSHPTLQIRMQKAGREKPCAKARVPKVVTELPYTSASRPDPVLLPGDPALHKSSKSLLSQARLAASTEAEEGPAQEGTWEEGEPPPGCAFIKGPVRKQ